GDIAGSITLPATISDPTNSNPTSLNVVPGALASITLTPSSSTIAADQTQTYTAEGFDAYGNTRGDRTAHTVFTIDGAGVCAANVCGSFVATDYTVTGTDGSFTDTSALHVVPAAAASLTVTPPASTTAGDPASVSA